MTTPEASSNQRLERDVADLQTRVTVLEMRYGDIARSFTKLEDLIRDQDKRLNALGVKVAVGAGGGASLVTWLFQMLGSSGGS